MIALQFSSVQTFVTRQVADYLSKELDTKVTLDKIYLKPFSRFELLGLQVRDYRDSTLLKASELTANLELSNFFQNEISISDISLVDSYVHIEIYNDSTNFSKYIQYFASPSKKDKQPSKKLTFNLDHVEIQNNSFRLINHKFKHPREGVNFANLLVTDFSVDVSKIKLDSIISAKITGLTLKEKSGLYIKEISSQASYSPHHMEFKDLVLKTNRSTIQDYIRFEYDSINDFTNFINDVKVYANVVSSTVDSRDIEFFAPPMRTVVFQTAIKCAKLSGTVSKIVAKDIILNTAKSTQLDGSFTIAGLPNINKTIFDFTLRKLTSTSSDIEYLVPLLANRSEFKLPSHMHRLGILNFNGNFVGLYNDFQIDGLFNTDLGNIKSNASIVIERPLNYVATIHTTQFDIGSFLQVPIFGNSSFDIDLQGQGLTPKDLDISFAGNLKSVDIKNYQYQDITFDGSITDKILQLQGDINDQNLKLDYISSVNWQNELPNYLLDADIKLAKINKLGWLDTDSLTINRAKFSTNLVGHTLNSIVGNFYADSIQLGTSKGDFHIQYIDFAAKGEADQRSLNLSSDVADARISGSIDLNTIVPYFQSLAVRYAPAIGLEPKLYNPQNFDLNVNVKSFEPIAALLDPDLILDDGAHLKAAFSSEDYTAQFVAFSPLLSYKGIRLHNIVINENADEHAFSVELQADRLNFADSTYINNIHLKNLLAKDSLHFNIELSDRQATNYLNLLGNIHFINNAPAYINLNPSTIIINDAPWYLQDENKMRVSKGKVYIDNLLLSQAEQQVKIDGVFSNKEEDQVKLMFNKFDLTSLNGITNPLGIQLEGLLQGEILVNSVFKKPIITSAIQTTPILYNQFPIGKLGLNASFDQDLGSMEVDLDLLDENNRGILVDGIYQFYDENQPLNLKGQLIETDLKVFQPFLKNLVSNLQGKANAEVDITGNFRNPKISGLGRFSNAAFTVNYLKTNYNLDNQIALVDNNAIMLQNLVVTDEKGHRAQANGIINLQKLANPYIDVDVTGNNFMILNTKLKDNNLYYGTAYATGTFKFKGYTSAIDIDINATSENGTNITIPFNSAMTVSNSDFIYFVSKDSLENKKREQRNLFKGLTMNMDLNLTPGAELNLQSSLGNLKGSGNGAVSMRISNLGDFEMFGDYVVNEGKFHFTAQDFINKYFDIKEGGTIRWTGNPEEAVVNLNALYQQRTAIGPLYNAAGRAGDDERVLAQAEMLIKGTLAQPDISFDINFPQNPYIKDQLQSYLSDANNVNQQALSLIVRRMFTPSSSSEISREVNNTLISAGAEIAFNQLNNIISESLNINFFDLNIRSLNDASASVRLLNDRLILTGGITDRTNYMANDLTFFRQGITTDAELTYRLRKDGSLMLRAYNRPYTRNFLIRMNDAEYISAAGLVYRQEFNSLQEFWRKLWTWGYKSDGSNNATKK